MIEKSSSDGASHECALITGANKGIGLAMARQLAQLGYAVWLGCRDQDRGEAAAATLRASGLDARVLVMDVTSDESVRAAARAFGAAGRPLDVLINNAGASFGDRAPPSKASIADMRRTYEVNTFGPVRVTQAFLPFLLRSAHARLVMVSSNLGSISEALDPTSESYDVNILGYNSSKAALNMITVLFAKELRGRVKVNAVNPGYTATDLNGHSGYRSVEEAAAVGVALATAKPNGPTAGFFSDGHYQALGRHGW